MYAMHWVSLKQFAINTTNHPRDIIMATNNIPAPLIVEPHPAGYTGYPFITLIQFNKELLLTIIDNMDDTSVTAYILDKCGPEEVNEEEIIAVAEEWFNTNSDRFPISFEFSKRGMTMQASKIFRTLNIDYISRVIGPFTKFDMDPIRNVRRRKRKELPTNIEILYKSAD